MEGKWKRQNILDRRHWGHKEQMAMIYDPQWINIRDPKHKLIKEPEKFWACYRWFMKQFEDKPPLLPLESTEWKLGSDYKELQSHLFMLNIDYTDNYTVPPSNWLTQQEKNEMDWEELEDENNRFVPVEPKLNRLVFRAKHVQDLNDESCNAPLEMFVPFYLFDKTFFDKKDMHKALEITVQKRFENQYEEQKKIRDDKRRRCAKKVAKFAQKEEHYYKKYRTEELKKRRRKTKSHDDLLRLSKHIEPLDELNIDFLEAQIVGFLPWTDDILDLPATRTKNMFRHDFKYAFDTPYQKPVAPYLELFEHGYLDVPIKKYQKQHGIETIDPNAEEEASDHDMPIEGNFIMKASELQNRAKVNQKQTLVAPYYQKKWE